MNLKRIAAPLLAALLLSTGTGNAQMLPYGGPINRRVDRNTAQSLDHQPEASRARTDSAIIGVTDLMGEISPFFANTTGDSYAATLLYDELLFTNSEGDIGAGVASFARGTDGPIYTFTINEKAVYADGARVTSDDFINALYLLAMPGFDGAYDITRAGIMGLEAYRTGESPVIEGITRIDDARFSVTLANANPALLTFLAIPALRLSAAGDMRRPEAATASDADAFYAEALARTRTLDAGQAAYGQYFLSEIEPGSRAVFAKNETYWRGAPMIGTLELLVVPEGEELAAIGEGTVDVISMLGSVEVVDEVTENLNFVNIFTWRGDVFGYFDMNTSRPILSDYRVRKALTIGLDRESARKKRIERYGSMPTMLMFDSFSLEADAVDEAFAFNTEAAAALLDEAGWEMQSDGFRWKDGEPLLLTVAYNRPNPLMDVILPEIQFDYEILGIQTELVDNAFEDHLALMASGDYDLCFLARRLSASAAVSADLFAGESHLNPSGYTSEALVRQLAAADAESDPVRQTVLLEMFYQTLYQELSMMPLYRRSEFLLANARVMNLTITPTHDFLADAYRLFLTDTLANQW